MDVILRRLAGVLQYLKYNTPKHIHTELSALQYGDNIPVSLEEAEAKLREILHNDESLILRPLRIKAFNHRALIIYINGLTDKKSIEVNVLRPLMTEEPPEDFSYCTNKEIINSLINEYIQSLDCIVEASLNAMIEKLMEGATIILLEGEATAIIVNSIEWTTRGVTEPETEAVIRGPREGFTEDILTNITLLRRKIKSPKLTFESTSLGTYSKTCVTICYLDGIADTEIIKELKKRLAAIKIDTILESGYIEQFIEDYPLSPFPSIGNTEKPDVVIGKLMEGRIAVLCDGTPFVLLVPRLFVENIQVSEDYYTRSLYATTLRFLRVFALFISTTLPALYVSIQTFHHEIVPFRLFIALTAAREGIPFTSVVEALMMVCIFELLKEAGLRMPKAVGQAISIVGAIVLGQATVEAGIASPLMVIVIALTAISSFIIPALDGTIFFLRIAYLIAGSIMGFYGITLAIVVTLIHMCNIKSFGIHYLSAMIPIPQSGLKDSYIRAPLWSLFFDNTSVSSSGDENPTND